jgi:YD repeat-containing protein
MDDDGNRTSVVTTPYGSGASTVSYTDNNLNQYTVVGGTNRSHDANGNVTDDGTYLYEYNYKNLICRAKLKSTGATVGEYKYDALGRRVEKTVTGATYRYIYSGVETVCVYTR